MANRWLNKRVLVIGAARQGQALARYLVSQGSKVILNDKQTAEKLQTVQKTMQGLGIQCVFGSHPLELLDSVDLVSVSGGVPLSLPLIVEAAKRRIPITNDSQIFLEEVKAPVIAITGSAGKTTTTSLVGKMAELAIKKPNRAWVGGNIGLPLVDHLEEIQPNDLVILEISSFQLEQMTISPHIAAVLNLTPNHLDRHGTMEAYTAAKARLLQFQKKSDIAILNREDTGSWALLPLVQGHLTTFGKAKPTGEVSGTFIEDSAVQIIENEKVKTLFPTSDIQIRGEHNRMNILAACTIAAAAGFEPAIMQKAVQAFRGVEHRLEWVRSWRDTNWYNDSIATAPERTIAAINSFSEPIVLLLGGRDKNLPWEDLARLIHHRVDHVIVFGEAAEKIIKAMNSTKPNRRPYSLTRVNTLHEAVIEAKEIIEPGDVVLLSPGGTSFDEFIDFEERGRKFRQWVEELS